MNTGLLLTLAFIAFMVVAAGALVVGLVVFSGEDALKLPETPSTTTSSSTMPSTTTSTIIHPSTTTSTSTSTTISNPPLSVSHEPDVIYSGDDVRLNVGSSGEPVTGASVYFDGRYEGPTEDGGYLVLSVPGGVHEVTVSLEGHGNASVTLDVDTDTYATSRDVIRELTPSERQQAFAEGKADIRFYESTACPVCRVVGARLNKLVDDNRDCIVYEKLSYYQHVNELTPLFGARVSLPLIIVEGSNGVFKANGEVSMTSVKGMVERASGCDVG